MSYIVYDIHTWETVTEGFNPALIQFVPCTVRFSEIEPQIIQDRMQANLITLSFAFGDITRFAKDQGRNFLAIQTNVGRQMEFELEIPTTLSNIRSNPPLAANTFISHDDQDRRSFNLDLGFNFCFLT